jgi:hypothetical protein
MKHSAELIKQVKDLYFARVKARKICEMTGLTIGQFQAMVYHKYQWHLRCPRKEVKVTKERPIDTSTIDKIIRLTNWGYHCAEIAEDQGLPLSQVYKIVEEAKSFGRIQKMV